MTASTLTTDSTIILTPNQLLHTASSSSTPELNTDVISFDQFTTQVTLPRTTDEVPNRNSANGVPDSASRVVNTLKANEATVVDWEEMDHQMVGLSKVS
jgi:hypothetical protein